MRRRGWGVDRKWDRTGNTAILLLLRELLLLLRHEGEFVGLLELLERWRFLLVVPLLRLRCGRRAIDRITALRQWRCTCGHGRWRLRITIVLYRLRHCLRRLRIAIIHRRLLL